MIYFFYQKILVCKNRFDFSFINKPILFKFSKTDMIFYKPNAICFYSQQQI